MTEVIQQTIQRKVFVGGPIQHATANGAFDQSLRELVDAVVGIFEAGGYAVLSAHRAERFGEISHAFSPEYVTRRDFDWMHACDLYVSILPLRNGISYRSDGTHVEIGWAGAIRRPVVIVGESPLGSSYTHLVRGLHQLTPVAVVSAEEVLQEPSLLLFAVRELLIAAYPSHVQTSHTSHGWR